MSKIVLYTAMSRDGFIADKNGGVSWLDDYNGIDFGYESFIDGIGALILGSKTYEQILTFGEWPYKGKKSYVVTKRDLPIKDGNDVELVDADVSDVADSAKRHAQEKDVWLVGGAGIAYSFLDKNLIDELIIFLVPKELGEGICLFKNGVIPSDFKQSKEVVYDKGMVMNAYQCS